MFAALGLWKWIAMAVVIAAVVGTAWYAKSQYDDGKRQEGAAAQAAKMQPVIDQLTIERDAHLANLNQAISINVELVATNKQTVALYQEQEKACLAVAAQGARAQEIARTTLARIAKQTKSHNARIVELVRRAQAPTIAGENFCEEADAISRSVLRERLRNRS